MMSSGLSRRSLLAGLAGATMAGSSRAAGTAGIKIGMGVRDLSDATLRFVRQLGVEWIAAPAQWLLESRPMGLIPPPGRAPGGSSGPWLEADIRRIRERAEAFGLRLGNLMLHGFPQVILGRPGRDRLV